MLVLASSSPRRRDLLKNAGIPFTVRVAPVDESCSAGEDPAGYVRRVAQLKASAAPAADEQRDLGGRAVIPGFVDSHTHLVFAGDRSAEFAARMTGTPYEHWHEGTDIFADAGTELVACERGVITRMGTNVLGGGLSKLAHLYEVLPDLMAPHIFADAQHVAIKPPRWGDAGGVRGAAWLWGRT